MTVARAVVFDRQGTMLAEIEPEWEFVNWRLNHEGMCRFRMSWQDAKCTADNLKLGNRLLVEFDNGLPDWGGVIDLPRSRRQGEVRVTGYTGEHLLDWRITQKARYFSSVVPGTIFATLLADAAGEYPLGVSVGSTYGGDQGRSPEYHYHDLLRRCQDLARLTGHDFVVLPVLSESKVLSFEAHWYYRRGTDKGGSVWLLDGANVMDPVLDEQGTMANRVVLVGEGTTWDDERAVAIAEDAASISEYGFREYSEVQSGVKETATLEANAAALLEKKKVPANLVTLKATNEEPGMFAAYDVGDIVTAKLFVDSPEWYFDGEMRVVAREWMPGDVCRLEVEEWG